MKAIKNFLSGGEMLPGSLFHPKFKCKYFCFPVYREFDCPNIFFAS